MHLKRFQNDSSRILITGADGFVGKALCEEMVLKGWKIRVKEVSRKGLLIYVA